MDKETKSTLGIIALYTIALVLTGVTHAAIIPDTFPFYGVSTVYLLVLAVFIFRYFYEKTIGEGALRRLLLFVAFLIFFWIVLRGAKYYFFWESGNIRRHLWYMYYIPQILIPVFTFYVSLMIDFTESMRIKKRWLLPVIAAVVMIGAVLTNDLHQKIFVFNPGFINWDSDYSYGVLFPPIIFFIYGSFLAAFFVMVCKWHKYYPDKPFWIVTLPFIIGTILLILSAFDFITINGTAIINTSEIQCYMSAAFLSACIKIGLISSSENHVKVLGSSSLDVSIFDNNGVVRYEANEEKRNLPAADILVKKYKFKNGYAIWREDVSQINEINLKLKEAYEQLSEESELIRLENDLKEQNAKI